MNTIGNITKDNTDNLLKSFVRAKGKFWKDYQWLEYIKYRLYYLLQQHENNKNYWTHIELTDLTFCYSVLKHHKYMDIDFDKVGKAGDLLIPIHCGSSDIC